MTAYNTFHFLGCFTGILVFARECRRAGLSMAHAVAFPLLALLVTRFASGILYGLEFGQWEAQWTNFFSFTRGGLSLYGGFYAGVFLVFIYSEAFGIGTLRMLDLISAPAAFTFAVGRLGCFFAGCCRGPEMPEGWMLPPSIPQPHLFPTPLVGSTLNFFIGLILLRITMSEERPGRRVGWGLILYGLARFGIEFIRTNRVIWAGMTLVQILSVPLVAVGVILLWWATRFPSAAEGAAEGHHSLSASGDHGRG